MTRYRVSHRTLYAYKQDVSLSHQVVRVEPRATAAQMILNCKLSIQPQARHDKAERDAFGNAVRHLVIDQSHDRLVIRADSEVLLNPILPPIPSQTPAWEEVAGQMLRPTKTDEFSAATFAFASRYTPLGPEIEAFARHVFTPGRPVLDAAIALNNQIFNDFTFDAKATAIDTPLTKVLRDKRGVCQDFTHIMLGALRAIRLPARYVSGYLLTRPPEGREKLIGADASHAWVSLWVPGSGWIDLDPTNGLLPFDEHITLGWGRDYGDVAPVSGVVYGGGQQTLDVSVDVQSM